MRKLLVLLGVAAAIVSATGGCGKEPSAAQKKEAESILPKGVDAQRPPPVGGVKPGAAAKTGSSAPAAGAKK